MTFDPEAICAALNDEGVRYVVIGGTAAVLHGSPRPTNDIDIVPERSMDNLDRLARALGALNARLRTGAEPVETTIDSAFLSAMPLMLNLVTDHGDLDITFTPAGPRADFDAWNADALDEVLTTGIVIRVASLDAVIDSKRAAGRAKDEMALPYLESLRDQLRQVRPDA